MPVMEYLERNARLYPDEVALVELNPDENDTRRMTWKEYALIDSSRIEERLHGVYLMKRQTVLLICFLEGE